MVPILIGAINQEKEAAFGRLLAPYIAREDTFCVVSSDFCHWWAILSTCRLFSRAFIRLKNVRGTRFSYTHYYPEPPPTDTPSISLSRSKLPNPSYPIHESIAALDHEAMELLTLPPSNAVEAHTKFDTYLKRTKNTICGRHPIGVLLGALATLEQGGHLSTMKWVRYEQSSQCANISDSSVSYASAYVTF